MPTVEVGSKRSDFCSKRCSMAALSRGQSALGGAYYLFDLLHLLVPMILEVPIENAIYAEGKPMHDGGSPCAPDNENLNLAVVDQFTKQW